MLQSLASPVRIGLASSALIAGLAFLMGEPAFAQQGGAQASASRPRLTEPGDFLPEIGSNEEFLKSLNLSEEQQTKLQEIRDDFRSVLFEFQTPEDQRKKEIKELNGEAVKLLSAEQKRTWEKRKQELLAQAKEAEGKNPTLNGGTPPANTPLRSTSLGPTAPAGTKPVASFDAPSAEGDETFDGEPRLSFNFQYAPWTEVLELFAKAADLTLDLTDTPSGTFSYRDSRSYTPTEALDVLNGYLLPRGYLLVRRDRFLVCLDTSKGIPPNLAPQVSVEDLPLRGKNELVSVVIPVPGLQADQVIDEVRELLGPQGRASALKNTNSIVVTDVGSHVRRIYALLTAESSVDNRDTAFKAIPLKFISASEAERMVRRLFGLNSTTASAAAAPAQPQQPWWMNGGGPGGFRGRSGFSGFRRGGDNDQDQQPPQQPTPVATPAATGSSQFANKIQVAADNRTNRLLVSASASLIQVVEEAVQAIDTDEDGMGNKIRNFEENLSLKIYSVPTGDVESIAQTIDTMIPGVVIGQDAKLGKLHIQATADEHKEVARLIEELGGEGSSSVAVIHLQKMEPVALANTLNSLYSKEGTRAPMVEADPLGRRLIVRGTPDQIMQLRTILTGLGEGDGAPREQDRGNVRSFSLGGRDPDEILPLLKDAWSATRPNPIRISIPSRPSPIRDRSVPGADRGDTSSEDPLGDSKSKNAALIRKAKFTSESPADADDEAVADEAVADEAPEAAADADAEASPVDKTKPDGDEPPVWMQVLGDEVIITSDDPKALDKLEQLYERLLLAVPPRTKWHVFYLRSADATETAQMIEQLMPSSSVTATTNTSSGLLGSMAGGFSNLSRGLMNASGLNQTLSASQTLRIVTDIRSNALFVSGPSDQVTEVEQILEVLDSSELPQSLRDRLPRTIAVEYADVEEVAEVVESVFKDAMTPETPMMAGGGGGRGGGFNPLAMLMGAAQNQSGRKQPGVQLTVGIDRRTNHLIVSCNDNLFQQIETLVQGIDDRAKKSRQTVRVVKLDQADPTLVQQTLGSLMPKVTVGTTRRSRRTTPADAGGTPGAPGSQTPNSNQPNTGTPNIPAGDAAMREIFMQRMQAGQGGNGGGNGGRFGGGNRGRFGGGGGDISNGGGRRGGGRSRLQGQ